jgi:AraC-like DNA-binding protein
MPINYLQKIQLGEFNEYNYKISPAEAMEAVVEGFYVFSRDQKSDTQLIFNDGFPVIVFLPSSEDSVTVTGQSDACDINGAWASAGSIKNVYIKYNSNVDRVFIVRFHPGAFYPLFGLSPVYFRNNPVVPFADIAGDNNFSIDRFFQFGSIEEKVTYIESYIRNYVQEVNTLGILHQTLDHIRELRGQSTVRDLSSDAGVNYKWLERSFLKNIGILPKEYIQLQRFIHAYLELVGNEDVDLMRIAISNGYYDANHFLKDFKSYTGKTPIEYLKFQSCLIPIAAGRPLHPASIKA